MQSGRAKASGWILEYETNSQRKVEPLMGWTSSGDTLNQVKLNFDTSADAVAFAEKNNWQYNLLTENKRRVKPRNYSDNFKYIPANSDKKA